MVTCNGNAVKEFKHTSQVLTTGGELTVRAFLAEADGDTELQVMAYDDYGNADFSFKKTFFTVDDFREWYRTLHIRDTVRIQEVIC